MRFLFSQALPDSVIVPASNGPLTVVLRPRAAAKRMTLRVSRATGEAVLTLPPRVSLQTALDFAERHRDWLEMRLAAVPQTVAFVPGAIIPFRGVLHRIVHWSKARGITQATCDTEGEAILVVTGDAAHVPRRIREFLRMQALSDLKNSVTRHTSALGVRAKRITLKDTSSRWGSCSAQGNLNFSWRLIMAPPLVLDYLAAHEVAHLREMNHSSRFWALTRRLCPHTDEAERWLKRHGAELHRYG